MPSLLDHDRLVTSASGPLAKLITIWMRETIVSLLDERETYAATKAKIDPRLKRLAKLIERYVDPRMQDEILREARRAGYTPGDLQEIARTNPRRLVYLEQWRAGVLKRAEGVALQLRVVLVQAHRLVARGADGRHLLGQVQAAGGERPRPLHEPVEGRAQLGPGVQEDGQPRPHPHRSLTRSTLPRS